MQNYQDLYISQQNGETTKSGTTPIKGHMIRDRLMKRLPIIKQVLAVCLIFLLSINSFAAIVSDNDGSAFVTKAEFDALKASFNKQVDDYNASIDGKIDGAIASYLAGIQLSTTEIVKSVYNKDYNYIESFGTDNKLPIEQLNGSFSWDCLDFCVQPKTKFNEKTSEGWIKCKWVPQVKRYGNYNTARYDGAKYWNPTTYQRALVGDYVCKEVRFDSNARFWDTESPAQLVPCAYRDDTATSDTDMSTYVNFLTAASNSSNNRGIGWLATDTGKSDESYEYYINSSYALTTNNQIYKQVNSTWIQGQPFTVMTPYETNEGAHSYNKGCIPTSQTNLLKWEDKTSNNKTLTSFFAAEYKVPFVVFPEDPSQYNWIRSHSANSVVKATLNTKYKVEYNKGLYRQVSDYNASTKREWYEWPEGQSTVDPTPNTWTAQVYRRYGGTDQRWCIFFVPEDLGYAGIVFDANKDRRSQFYYDKTILNSDDTVLDNLLKTNPLSKGIPLFKIEKAGKISFEMPFINDNEYDCWFTKGPIEGSSNVRTTKPTNIYTIAGQNANGSVTVKRGTSITFDVTKDDYIYCTWALKNKSGGGKVKLPIEGVLTFEE